MTKKNKTYRVMVHFEIVMIFFLVSLHKGEIAGALQSGAACQLLPTQYPVLQSSFFWLSDDTVVFQVGLGLPPNGISPNPEVWYAYEPSIEKLEQLTTMPDLIPIHYAQVAQRALTDYQPFDASLVRFSPSGRKVLYTQGDRTKNNLMYWLKDVDSNKTYSLDIPTYSSWMPTVDWFPNENQFIIQADASQVSPIYQVTLGQDGIRKTDLTALAPFKELGLGAFQNSVYGYWVAGLNPSGTTLILQPDGFTINEIYEHNAWIFDLTKATLQKPDFVITGDFQVRWKDDSTFIALSNLGVIEYDIRTQSTRVLLTLEETHAQWFGNNDASLSPKADFVISRSGAKSDDFDMGAVRICAIPE